MYDRLQLTNMLRSEVERIPETGLPMEVFPARIQELILNLARYENFNVEYTASILLSAVATAIGNSCRIRIKGEWKTSPSIYMMLVGRPGLGKTPPLGFLYKPIREHDDRMYEKYNEEWNAYEKALASSGTRRGGEAEECTLLRKPQLVTTVISDFTPEAMMSTHQHNPRGIALVVDEIRALFNSVKRYNNRNNLIEDLLTAYSGQPLKVIRKSSGIRASTSSVRCRPICCRRSSGPNTWQTDCSTAFCSSIRKTGGFRAGSVTTAPLPGRIWSDSGGRCWTGS